MQSTKSLTHETKNNKLFKSALYGPEKATVDELKAALITLNISQIEEEETFKTQYSNCWRNALKHEYEALEKFGTWTIEDWLNHINVIGSKYLVLREMSMIHSLNLRSSTTIILIAPTKPKRPLVNAARGQLHSLILAYQLDYTAYFLILIFLRLTLILLTTIDRLTL
uniref:Uncharacterized protein n=1 Tax=Glossina pallidipes TaxID=7398 RepID=A0A1A9ZA66_GLOPL